MKAKKWLTWITLGIAVITAICVLAIRNALENTTIKVVYDICLACFGSATLGFIMSLTEYFVAKRYAMERFYEEAVAISCILREALPYQNKAPLEMEFKALIEYRDPLLLSDGPPGTVAKSAICDYLETHYPIMSSPDSYDAELQSLYESEMHRIEYEFGRCIERYCVIASKISIAGLHNAYGELDFLFGNNTARKTVYEKILKPITDEFNAIKIATKQFQIYIAGNGNLRRSIRCFQGLQEKYFVVKTEECELYSCDAIYNTYVDSLDNDIEHFRASIYRTAPTEHVPIPVSGYRITDIREGVDRP